MELEIDPSGIAITDTTTNTNNVAIDSSNIDISGTHKIILNDTNGISINNLTLQPTNTLGSATNITIDELAHLSGVSSNIQTQFNLLKGDAPAALDTIAELADAIGDNANFVTTVNTDIAAKVGKTGDETISGIKTIQGSLNFDTNGTISGDVIPVNNNLTNIGSASKQINAIHANDVNVSGDIHMNGNIDIGGGNFTITNEELSKLDGVSDNIQTQINTAIAGNVWDQSGVKIHYNSGNVGIGTNDPTGKLEVHNGPIIVKPGTNATNALQFHSGSGNANYTNDIAWYDSNGTKKVMIGSSSNDTTGHFRFWENGSQDFTFINDASNTKVGINRVDPQYNLDISGDVNFTGTLYQNGSEFNPSFWSESNGNVYRSSGKVGIGTTSPDTPLHIRSAGTLGQVLKVSNTAANSSAWIELECLADSGNAQQWGLNSAEGGQFRIYKRTGIGAGTWALNIDGDGKVGIGDTTPSYKLDVAGDVNFTGNLYKNGSLFSSGAFTSGTGKAYYTGGNVGIGTTNPAKPLEVYSDGNGIAMRLTYSGNSSYYTDFRTNGININPQNSFSFDIQGNEKMRINSNGNVGIGTTNPICPLHIAGHANPSVSGYSWVGSTTGDILQFKNNHSSTTQQIGLKVDRNVMAYIYLLASDERIKTDISLVSDDTALNQVNSIESYEYNYIEPTRMQPRKTIGFLAQEVKNILPNAVNIITDTVPDEMRIITQPIWIDCSYSTIRYEPKTTYTETVSYEEGPLLDSSGNPVLDQSGNQIMDPSAVRVVGPSGTEHVDPSGIVIEEWHPKWKLQIPDLDMSSNNTGRCRFYFSNDLSGNDETIKNLALDPSSNNTFEAIDERYNNVFFYGKEVNDFHTLDKAQIFALHHSAIQELSRKNDALNTEKETMQTEITTLLEENNSMKSRLEALEAAIINLQNN